VQRELGDLFRRLVAIEAAHASRGRAVAIMAARDAIYTGDIAREIVAHMKKEGGALSAEDLASYRVSIEAPVHSTYRGIDVYACGPWSQGPLVPMTLNLLEGYDIASLGPGSLPFLHRYTEAMKLSCADREGFFGDPDQVDVPIRGLLDKAYAEERRGLIRDDRAWPELPPPPWPRRARAASTSLGLRKKRASSAINRIMMVPPMYSLSANCQPMRIQSTRPSSSTRLVDAIIKIIAVVKSARFWNSDLAIALAA